MLGGSEEAEAKGRQVVVDCRCNAAVCGWRGGDLEGVKTAATKASGYRGWLWMGEEVVVEKRIEEGGRERGGRGS